MTKKHPRSRLGQVPPERGLGVRPRQRSVPATPKGGPLAQARAQQPAKAAPKERGIGATPNPRKPKLVRDVHGNELKDLFVFFPDLPRPRRRAAKVPARRPRRR